MQKTEPPTKIYEPHHNDPARISALSALASSDAPVRIYTPQR